MRRGEHGALITKYGTYEREDKQTGETETGMYLKAYTVFNADQCDGLPDMYRPKPMTVRNPDARIAKADAFFTATGSKLQHGGDRAFYSPHADYIQMPHFDAFDTAIDYYSTLAHEHTHWTGHKARLDRRFGASFGNSDYAFEELVAEFGAAFVMGSLELETTPREDHAAYLASWAKMLRDKPKAFLDAAGLAQKACDFLHGETQAMPVAA